MWPICLYLIICAEFNNNWKTINTIWSFHHSLISKNMPFFPFFLPQPFWQVISGNTQASVITLLTYPSSHFHFHFHAQVSLTTWAMSPSVPVSRDSEPVWTITPETEAAKWNSAIINLIIYTCSLSCRDMSKYRLWKRPSVHVSSKLLEHKNGTEPSLMTLDPPDLRSSLRLCQKLEMNVI